MPDIELGFWKILFWTVCTVKKYVVCFFLKSHCYFEVVEVANKIISFFILKLNSIHEIRSPVNFLLKSTKFLSTRVLPAL